MIRVTVVADLDETVVRDAWAAYRADGGPQPYLAFRRRWAETFARELSATDPSASYEVTLALDVPEAA